MIPFGGGTSVVGGVEPRGLDARACRSTCARSTACSRSTAPRARRGSRRARPGPGLEDQLREHELTLRHFPQSFEYSTLGGWIATRAGGHFATLMTHIDDLVESVRALTPGGWWESRRLPGSGAGPSPDRMLIGSEGTLGVITEAWMRVQDRPRWKASAGVLFDTFAAGRRGGARAGAVRAVAVELPAARRGRGRADDGRAGRQGAAGARLRVGRPPGRRRGWTARSSSRATTAARRASRRPGAEGDSVGTWRNAFVQAPYLRDTFVAGGVISETFETAITWDRLEAFVAGVRERAEGAVAEICGEGRVTLPLHARLPGRPGALLHGARARRGAAARSSSGTRSRRAVSEAIIDGGGTITHHHAVGPRPPALVRPSAPGRRSPRRCGRPSARSTRAGTSIPACCWTPRAEPDAAAEHRLGHAVRLDLVAAALDPRAELVQAGGCLRGVAHLSNTLPVHRSVMPSRSSPGRLTSHDPRMSPKSESSAAPTASSPASGGCGCRCPGPACRT